jgi:shikimate dehydrogenase
MKKCYLLGYPIEHSMSAIMHNHAFKLLGLNYKYELKSVKPRNLARFIKEELQKLEFVGASITIPHKVEIMRHLDSIDGAAMEIGAVNTILHDRGTLKGYNTDGVGAIKALKEVITDLSESNVIVLGAGGASRALSYYLARETKNLTILNRTPKKAANMSKQLEKIGKSKVRHGNLEKLSEIIDYTDILINTTSVGMNPNNEASPVSANQLHSGLLVFDIVYNPIRTQLIKDAEAVGAKTLSGVKMLVYQGTEAFKLWTGINAPETAMIKIVKETLEAKPN